MSGGEDSVMPESDRVRLRETWFGAFALSVAMTFAAATSGPAQAQNLLESLFGIRPAGVSAPVSTVRSDPNAWDFIDKAPKKSSAQRGARNSYCVRLCDGRFFPLPRSVGASQMSSAQVCSAMCPAAETRVFNGTAIERAVAKDGKPYASLETAFLFREKQVDRCSCARDSLGSVAAMDVKDDPTLRRGDIVVTRDGPVVFTGASRAKDREQAFVPAAEYTGLSKSIRQELAGMRIARDPSETAALPGGVVPATLVLPVSHEQDAALTPIEEAFASFAR
jgi:hypothetical protein